MLALVCRNKKVYAVKRALLFITILFTATGAMGAGAGKKMYDEFVENGQIYPHDGWQDYVTNLGQKLLQYASGNPDKYKFTVLDNAQINAFATPDAFIFVNRGLLAFLSSEEQLAAVIGHEIGHVVGEHARRRKVANLLGKTAGIAAAMITGRGELYDVSNAATTTLLSGYGREMELEADRYGAEFLARSGYNPLAMIEVVQVLKDQELFSKQVANQRSTYHGLFSSHPKNDKRLHEVVAYAQSQLPDLVTEQIGDFWSLIDGLSFGDEAAAGIVRGQTFFHGGLRIAVDFPESWTVTNTPSQVVGKAPGGKKEGQISVARHEPVKRKSPEQYVVDVLKRDDVVDGSELELNGLKSYVGELEVEDSESLVALIGVIYRGKHVFLFRGEAGPNIDATTFRTVFIETLKTLRGMTAEDVQMANTRRVKVLVADPHDTYAKLAQRSAITRYPEESLRLLNGGHPHGEPRAGDFVKIIE